MAGLTITVGGNNITDYVDVRSIVIEEIGTELVATCRFFVRDHTGTVAIDPKDDVDIDDDGTTIYAGEVASVSDNQEGITKTWSVTCHDYNVLLDETVIESESYTGQSDSGILSDLFTNYRSDIDASTYVSTLDATMEDVAFAAMTLREILDDLASRTGARYYVDYDKNLHWFDTEASSAAFSLSSSPDMSTSYPFGGFRRVRRGAKLAEKVYVLGKEVDGWYPSGAPSYDGSARHAVSRDQRITTAQGVVDRGQAIYDRYNAAQVTYELWTEQDGLHAGDSVTLVNEVWGINDSFYIRRIRTTFIGTDGELRRHQLSLNDEGPEPSRIARHRELVVARLETEINSVSDTIFDTDAPAAPTALGGGNVTTDVSIDVDGKQIVYAEITWSAVADSDLDHYEVQLSTQADFSSDVQSRNHPAGGDRVERFVGLVGNTTYYVRVRASDWVGNDSAWDYGGGSAHSFTSAADTSAPADPTGVAALATPVSVHVSWDANGEGDFSHYEIQRKPDGGAYSDLATCNLTFFIDNTVSIGTNYWYRVRAVDTSGNASNYVEIASAVGPEVIGPGSGAPSLLGWSHDLAFTSSDHNTVAWSSGSIETADGTTYSIDAGNTGNIAAVTYIYLDTDTSTSVLQTSTTASDAVGANRILIAVAKDVASGKLARFQVFGGDNQGTPLITANNITANTITADEIAANTITSSEIAAGTITATEIAAGTITANEIAAGTITATEIAAGTITANELAANSVTAAKIDVAQLSAIAADLGTITAGTVTGATIRTAASGARVILDSIDGVRVFNASGTLTAQFDVDGSGQLGSSDYEPIVWNAAGEINRLKANQINLGDPGIFSESDGLLLLGPGCPITTTSWTSLRGQSATISGAFHQSAGRWPGTRALVVEEGTTNYCTNPRMYDGNSDGAADGWASSKSGSGTLTKSIVSHQISGRGWMQRLQYTAATGDSGETVVLRINTTASTFSPGDDCTFSADITLADSVGDITYKLRLIALDSGGAALGTQDVTISPSESLQRFSATYSDLPASTDRVSARLRIEGIHEATSDEFDIYIGAVNIEKGVAPTSFCAGVLDWCAWSGTADASTSSRTVTEVNLDDNANLLSANDTWSVSLWYQPQYDSDADWPSSQSYIFDARGADNNNRVIIQYLQGSDAYSIYINGSNRGSSAAQSFSAGEWQHVVLTADFSNDVYRLYINASLVVNNTTALSAPTLTEMNLGSSYASTAYPNAAYSELVIFDTVLTAEEVSALYQRNSALIDNGALDAPGIYILDGKFTLATSLSGARTEISPSGWFAYDADGNEAFGLSLEDGKSWGGFTMDKADIVLGNNVAGSSAISWDQSTGKFGFYGGGGATAQVEVGTDGALLAGAGDVTLDSDGITITQGLSDVNKIKWESDGSAIFTIVAFETSDDNYGIIDVRPGASASDLSRIDIRALAYGTQDDAMIQVRSQSSGAGAFILLHIGGADRFEVLYDEIDAFVNLDMNSNNIVSVGTVDGIDVSAHDHGSGGGATVNHGDLDGLAGDDHTLYLKASGTRSMTGDLDLGGNNIDDINIIALNSIGTSHPSAPASGVLLYHGVIGGVNGVWIQWGDGHKELIASN